MKKPLDRSHSVNSRLTVSREKLYIQNLEKAVLSDSPSSDEDQQAPEPTLKKAPISRNKSFIERASERARYRTTRESSKHHEPGIISFFAEIDEHNNMLFGPKAGDSRDESEDEAGEVFNEDQVAN